MGASTKAMADAIRMLAVDAVEAAKSGHPGAPMGMAEIALALWHRHLRHNPANPHWADRDRFVLSNGHGSMLIYALLHLTGYALLMAELKAFRQPHSLTPGHPEVGITPGVETTTGPLGQGLANAVGMALPESLLAAEFNSAGHRIVDHFNYVFLSDGCLMEGISHEVCSLAGIAVRVVSMPSTSVFDRQDAAWQKAVLPLTLPAVAVEAAHPDLWRRRKYVGRGGGVVGIASFGESAPAQALYAHFGITAEAAAVRRLPGVST